MARHFGIALCIIALMGKPDVFAFAWRATVFAISARFSAYKYV